MKRNTLLSALCALGLITPAVQAATFCVADATALSAALNIADNNAQDDDIRIQSGTIVGTFIYNANVAETGNLILRGGYDATCTVSSDDPTDSVIDGAFAGRTLVLSGRDNSSLSVSSLTVTGGLGQTAGGGLDIDRWTQVTIANNRISGNAIAAGQDGTAGMEIDRSVNVVVTRNTFASNSGVKGGALSISDMASAQVLANHFVGNSAADGGAALDMTSSGAIVMANNLLASNNSDADGGAMSVRVEELGGIGSLQATNNTFVNNLALGDGGALDLDLTGDSVSAALHNNVFWNNTAARGADMNVDNDDDRNGVAGGLILENNDFNQAFFVGFWSRIAVNIAPSNFNLVDPMFVAATEFRLAPNSPLIDAGDSGAPAVGTEDLDGSPRIQGAAIDLGAYETSGDSDLDGVADAQDNCTEIANADQRDSNGDGFGNVCDADLNNDGAVNAVDLGLFRLAFFSTDADADFNGDGIVNVADLGTLRTLFGRPPGPSGVAP